MVLSVVAEKYFSIVRNIDLSLDTDLETLICESLLKIVWILLIKVLYTIFNHFPDKRCDTQLLSKALSRVQTSHFNMQFSSL